MLNLGKGFMGEVLRIDQLRSANLWKGVKPDAPKAFAQLVEELTPNTSKAERGPLRRRIAEQLDYLSQQSGWPSFGMKSITEDGQRWIGPKMNDGGGDEVYWCVSDSEGLQSLSEGLDQLGWDKVIIQPPSNNLRNLPLP
jgi:hypothetical protein